MNGTNFSQPATFKWITEPTDIAETNVDETIVKEDNSNTQEVDEMNMEELKAFIADSLNAMKESLKSEILDSLKAMEDAEVEEPEEVTEDVTVKEAEMASETLPVEPELELPPVNDEVEELKAKLAELMAERDNMACKTKLSEDTAGIQLVDEDKVMLEKVMKIDPEVYQWMLTKLEELAKAGATVEEEKDFESEKTSMSQRFKTRISANSMNTSKPKDIMDQAHELAEKEGISFALAVKRLSK